MRANISWKEYKLKYLESDHKVEAHMAMVELPAIWPGTPQPDSSYLKTKTSTFTVHLRQLKIKDAKVERIVIMLEGGPGANTNSYEEDFDFAIQLFGKNSLFVLYNHRGVGKSSKVMRSSDTSFVDIKVLKALIASTPYPLPAITTINAAHDVAAIADAMRAQHASNKVEVIVYGSSYGTRLAIAAANVGGKFDLVILEGIFGNQTFPLSYDTVGKELLENCMEHAECSKRLGPNQMRLFNLLPEVIKNPGRNECSKYVAEYAKSWGSHRWNIADLMKMLMRAPPQVNKMGERGDLRLFLALLLQMESCSSLIRTKQIVAQLKKTLEIALKEANGLEAFQEIKELKRTTNKFGFRYIFSSALLGEKVATFCDAKNPPALMRNTCPSAQDNYEVAEMMKTIMGPAMIGPDQRIKMPIQSNVPILAFQGALDFITPLQHAQWIKTSKGKVYFHVFKNMGHSVINTQTVECAKEMVDAALRGSDTIPSCLSALNSKTLDWDPALEYFPAAGPANPLPNYVPPPTDNESRTIWSRSNLLKIGLGILLFLGVAVLIFILVRKYRRKEIVVQV